MSNIVTAAVTITGTRPMLWNAFTPESIPLQKKEKTGVAGNDPMEWHRSVLVTPERQLYVEPTYVFGCLRDGAKHIKRGRGSLQPLIVATLQVVDDKILADQYLPADDALSTDSAQSVYLDVRSVKNPSTRGRNVRYRVAAASGWSMTFRIEWDKTVISRGEMETIITDAGRLVGLGDGRSIGFGRFAVNTFTVNEE